MKTRASTRAATVASKRRKTSCDGLNGRHNGSDSNKKCKRDNDMNQLIDACIRADYDGMMQLLAQPEWKIRINECGHERRERKDRRPPLWYAVQSGDDRIVRALLDGGGDPTLTDRRGRHLLHVVIQHGTVGMLEMLLSREDVDPNVRDYDGETPLFFSHGRNTLMMRMLLAANADPNIVNKAGISPLTWFIDCGLEEHVLCLLDAKANPNLAVRTMDNPLIAAISCDLQPTIRRLLMAGANPNLPMSSGDQSPLTYAIEKDEVDTVRLLLKAGADPNSTAVEWSTPLVFAVAKNRPNMVQILLQGGANPNMASKLGGSTPLLVAIRNDHRNIIQMLLEGGADPNLVGRMQLPMGIFSPLKLAMELGNAAVVRLLLRGSADPNRIWNNQLPLYEAARKGNVKLVKLLLDFKADPHLSTTGPDSLPFFVAARNNHSDVMYLLLPYMLFKSPTRKAGL